MLLLLLLYRQGQPGLGRQGQTQTGRGRQGLAEKKRMQTEGQSDRQLGRLADKQAGRQVLLLLLLLL